ncbi:hypothetical protein HDU99_002034, partial [Rhizoclosmatium hyalinum]
MRGKSANDQTILNDVCYAISKHRIPHLIQPTKAVASTEAAEHDTLTPSPLVIPDIRAQTLVDVKEGDMIEALFQVDSRFGSSDDFFVSGFHWETVRVVDVLEPTVQEYFEEENVKGSTKQRKIKKSRTVLQFKVQRLQFLAPQNIWVTSEESNPSNTSDCWMLQDDASEPVILTEADCRLKSNPTNGFDDSSFQNLRPYDPVEVRIISADSQSVWWFPGTVIVPYSSDNGQLCVQFGYMPPGSLADGAGSQLRIVDSSNIKILPLGCERLFHRLSNENLNILSEPLKKSYLNHLQFTPEELQYPIYISIPDEKGYAVLFDHMRALGFNVLNMTSGKYALSTKHLILSSALTILCFKSDYLKNPNCMEALRFCYNLRLPIIPMLMKHERVDIIENLKDGGEVVMKDVSRFKHSECFGLVPEIDFIDLRKFGRWPFNMHVLFKNIKKVLHGHHSRSGPLIGSMRAPPELGSLPAVIYSNVPQNIETLSPGAEAKQISTKGYGTTDPRALYSMLQRDYKMWIDFVDDIDGGSSLSVIKLSKVFIAYIRDEKTMAQYQLAREMGLPIIHILVGSPLEAESHAKIQEFQAENKRKTGTGFDYIDGTKSDARDILKLVQSKLLASGYSFNQSVRSNTLNGDVGLDSASSDGGDIDDVEKKFLPISPLDYKSSEHDIKFWAWVP